MLKNVLMLVCVRVLLSDSCRKQELLNMLQEVKLVRKSDLPEQMVTKRIPPIYCVYNIKYIYNIIYIIYIYMKK